MLLCFDIGNTHIVMAIVKNKQIIDKYRFATDISATEDEYALRFQAMILEKYQDEAIEAVIISSVVPPLDKIMEKTFVKHFAIKPMFVAQGVKSGLHIKLENPKQLGADLLIGAVAAYEKYRDTTIIVDLGTATKFSVVTKNAEFLGGIIVPGVYTSLDSLFSKAAKLFQISIEEPKTVIGRDTTTSIQSGTVYGTACMIDGLIAKIHQEIGQARVILTGGIAPLIDKVITTPHDYDPDLLIKGLIIIYYKNC